LLTEERERYDRYNVEKGHTKKDLSAFSLDIIGTKKYNKKLAKEMLI
jgi:hypothetical protein